MQISKSHESIVLGWGTNLDRVEVTVPLTFDIEISRSPAISICVPTSAVALTIGGQRPRYLVFHSRDSVLQFASGEPRESYCGKGEYTRAGQDGFEDPTVTERVVREYSGGFTSMFKAVWTHQRTRDSNLVGLSLIQTTDNIWRLCSFRLSGGHLGAQAWQLAVSEYVLNALAN